MPRDISSSSSSSDEDEEPGPETHADTEPTETRRTRFQCPADFVSFSYKPCSSTVKTTSSSELWLIKAPTSFDPQCFSGVQLPLCGLQTLKVPSREGEEHIYSVLGSSHCSPEFRLLTSPKNAPQHASLASPFVGLISVCQSYGHHGTHPALHVVPAAPPPSLMPGLKQRFQHTAFKSAAPSPAEGEARRKRRREKKIKLEPEEECERAKPEELRSCIKIKTETEVKPEPLDPQYREQAERRRKKKKRKKSKSDD